jgi:hypothetical protein
MAECIPKPNGLKARVYPKRNLYVLPGPRGPKAFDLTGKKVSQAVAVSQMFACHRLVHCSLGVLDAGASYAVCEALLG